MEIDPYTAAHVSPCKPTAAHVVYCKENLWPFPFKKHENWMIKNLSIHYLYAACVRGLII